MKDLYLVAVGFRGKLDSLGVATLDDYLKKQKKVNDGEIEDFPPFSPIFESIPGKEPIIVETGEGQTLTARVQEVYAEVCNKNSDYFTPGPFGDFIQLFRLDDNKYQMFLSQKAFHKPGLAADLGVIIQGKDLERDDPVFYLVTGVRKADPGKGKPAWFGGFRDICRNEKGIFVFDSSAYTLLHEAREEAGLVIEHEDPESLRTDYMAKKIPVNVRLGADPSNILNIKAEMHYIGTIATSDLQLQEGGEVLPDGSKRVYATDGYLILVNLKDRYVNKNILSEWLTAGDDIEALKIFDATPQIYTRQWGDLRHLHFGIRHHRDFLAPMLMKASEIFYGK